MRSRRSEIALVAFALAMSPFAARAEGDEPPPSPADSPDVARAREEFVRGTALAKSAQWAEALAAFERSAALRPHAITTYNVGICHRALGNYTLARETLAAALAQNETAGGQELAASLVADSKALLGEIDGLLATAKVHLTPANAKVAVDGRPLAARAGSDVLVAGVQPPGPGEPAPRADLEILLSPGAHVFTFSRPGFADAVVNRTLAPGSTTELRLELDRLPATMHVGASASGAVVTVNDVDVGVAPVDVSRPPGTYRVVVKKSGFSTFDQKVSLSAGQEVDLRAPLAREETPITKRWWFWTAAGTLLVGVAAGTYALTRSESTRQEPLDGGGLGWTVRLQ